MKKINKTIKIDEKQYEKIKKIAEDFKESMSKILKLTLFGYLDEYLSSKNKAKDTLDIIKSKKKIMTYLTEKEIKFLEKNDNKKNISLFTRNILNIALEDKELEEKIKFFINLDKEINFDFSSINIMKKLYPTYKKTNLTPLQIFEKLILNLPEEKLIEIIKNN